MAFDHAMIGQMAAELMEEAAERYGDDAEIKLAGLLIAVEHGDEITYHGSFRPKSFPHEQLGLLEQISRHISGSSASG